MNILTFDIEEWYIEKKFFGAKESKYVEYDRLLDELLCKLEETGLKATFFCVGKMASEFPLVVRKIAEAGHEIGCHSNSHRWLNKMGYEQAMEDTHIAVDSLQQCIGAKVTSYRAPAFSIGNQNKWAVEVLAANGITCDASVFPASRDFGGFLDFSSEEPTVVQYNGIAVHEFPVMTANVLGKRVAYSGGGYFRLFPYCFIEKELKKSGYSMTYFHLGDMCPIVSEMMSKEDYERYFQEPGTIKSRYKRTIKANLGIKNAKNKLYKLLNNIDFINISQADQRIDWSTVPSMVL